MNDLRPHLARLGRVALLSLLPVLTPAALLHAQVTDGGFEAGSAPDGGFATLGAGSSFGGWTVASGSIDLIDRYWMAAAGNQSVDMSGNSAGAIFQDFVTTPGSTWDLSFSLAGNPDGGPAVKSLSLFWGPSAGSLDLVGTYTFDATGRTRSSMGWVSRSAPGLVASTASTRLWFASATSTPYGPALDEVALSEAVVTPEPGSLLLALAGLAGLGLVALRRRSDVAG